MKHKWIKQGAVMGLFTLSLTLSGCRLEDNVAETEMVQEKVRFAQETEKSFQDNDALYEDEDPTSVETMYLTVSRGNPTESTNHSWKEVNDYSVYYYEERDIDRFGVNALVQFGDEQGPVSGKFGYGRIAPNAIVTVRGQSSSENPVKNYKITLKDNAGTWNGQSVINLNKHVMEGMRFRNKLMYDLQKDIPGMIAMRTQFVHLYVRDLTQGEDQGFVDYGLYTQVEQPTKKFLKAHGLDRNGYLYKENMLFEFYRYEDDLKLVTDEGYDEEKFRYHLKTKGHNDHTKLLSMLDDVNDFSTPIGEVLDHWFDRDNLATWLAFNILTGNTDTQSRNTLLYSSRNGDTWYFLDWDCDTGFYASERMVQNEQKVSDLSGWECGVSNYWGNVLFQRALKDANFRRLLDEKVELLRTVITKERVTELAQQYAKVTKPYLYEGADWDNAALTEEEFDHVLNTLADELDVNYQNYKSSLEKPLPFYIGRPQPLEDGLSFTWDTAYDFQGDGIRYRVRLADNPEMQDPIDDAGDLFLNSYTYTGKLEPGQYFVQVTCTDTDGNEQYAFDFYSSAVDGIHYYGVVCFYVDEEGNITLDGEVSDEAAP